MKKLMLLLTIGFAAAAGGQTTNAPRTYFETCNAVMDALLFKGSTVIDTLNNQITYPVEIRAERLVNMITSNTVYAVSLRTTLPQDQVQVDYIDYDELDTLIHSLQAISQADNSITPLDNFEAVIRTRSGLSVAKLGRGSKTTIAMTPGATNYIFRNKMESYVLDQLTRDLTAAKAKIDAVSSSGQ